MFDLSKHPASFRDPSGFVFQHQQKFYRYVHQLYANDYEQLIQSGLYQSLLDKNSIIAHHDVSLNFTRDENCHKILLPQQVSCWTYPYEWSFGQLKDAALLTLQLAQEALQHDMCLKDATAYNMQFAEGKPILIDSLSFEKYEEGKPWQAFKQFCEHFLYPLLLYKYTGLSPAILQAYPDGMHAEIIHRILPLKSRLNFNNWLYVFLPASISKKQNVSKKQFIVSKNKIVQNLQQLSSFIQSLFLDKKKSAWNNYYQETILSRNYLQHKTELIQRIFSELNPDTTIDVGCNTGTFSLLAANYCNTVIAFDDDTASIDSLYKELKTKKQKNILPFVADITNPSPATGWNNKEHSPLLQRVNGDMVMMLALMHHLCLAKNISLKMLSGLSFQLTTKYLLIEFVPKTDLKSQILLQSKKDIYDGYSQMSFEQVFSKQFTILQTHSLSESERVLYLMEKK